MKIFVFCLLGVAIAAGCVVSAPQTRMKTTNNAVHIVGQKPQGCKFLAGISGSQNDAGRNWSEEWLDNIRTDAQRLGGNVVYLRAARAGGHGSSDEYFNDFYVGGVQYGGLVYKCP